MTIHLKIQLRGISNPLVWRRIIIPGDYTFEELHEAIQYAFGWYNEHLYQFQQEPYSQGWCITDLERNGDSFRVKPKDAAKTKVGAFLKEKKLKKFTYLYDFGDDWVHDITVEQIDREADVSEAVSQGGRGTCPPEDCGGPYRYEYMKRILKEQPDSKEAQEWREWLGLKDGDTFDPDSYAGHYIDDLSDAPVDGDEYEENSSSNDIDVDELEDTTLLECMSHLNIDMLNYLADNMHLGINLDGNEEERRMELASQIISHAGQVLVMLPYADLFILQYLKDTPTKSHTIMMYDDVIAPIMVTYGLARDFVGKDGHYYIQIPVDLWQQWETLIDLDETAHKDKEQASRLYIENFIEGVCNLYGKVTRSMMKDLLVAKGICDNMEMATAALHVIGERSLLMKFITYSDEQYHTDGSDDKTCYVSRYGGGTMEALDKELRKHRRHVKDYKDFTVADIMKANNYPIPTIPNSCQADFEDYLQTTLALNEVDIVSLCHHFWYYTQHKGEEGTVSQAEYFMEVLMDDTEHELEPEEYVTAMRHLDNYLNNMPHWQLRGHTPSETGLMVSDIGSKFSQIHGFLSQHFHKQHNQPEQSDSFDEWFSPTMPYIAPKTPGRNDPCPCGSGKKYKNCCGRGN